MQGFAEWTNNKSQPDIWTKSRHDRSAAVIALTRGHHDATHHASETHGLPNHVESFVTMNVSGADRLLTLYLFRPIQRRLGAQRQFRIPILMYHSVSGQTAKGSHSYYELNTSTEVFDLHMSHLKQDGYRIIGLGEALDRVCGSNSENAVNGEKYVVLTFDDGFRNFHDHAYPILKKYGFGATVFLSTDYIERNRGIFEGRECMTWEEVRFLSDEGIVFGSHAVTHEPLISLDMNTVKMELMQSKERIESETGKPVEYFSYPYRYPEHDKEFIRRIESLLALAGYRAAVSTRIGTVKKGDGVYSLKRIPISTNDCSRMLAAKLEGAYDWLYRLQYLKKRSLFLYSLHGRRTSK
jgi:peptidoglycan/xylan/chitin deacetylase (PgdA/CDA1 family)